MPAAGSGHRWTVGMVPSMSPLGDTAQGVPQVCGAEGPQGNVHAHCSSHSLQLAHCSFSCLALGSRGDIFWGLLISGWVGEGAAMAWGHGQGVTPVPTAACAMPTPH